MSALPLVSIGIPIRNEAQFLRQTLDSLLAQDYPNIEIIISDNASDDETGVICHEYSEQHPNLSYRRLERNIGLVANFIKVLNQSQGKYHMWACGHDLWSDNYISKCVATLESHPDAVLANPTSEWIDHNGQLLTIESGYNDTRGMDIIARYFTVFWGNIHPGFGLIRSDILKQYPAREVVGADLILLTFLALRGDFVHASGATWKRREFRFESTYKKRLQRYKKGDQQVIRNRFDLLFPLLRLPYYLTLTVLNSPARLSAKVLILMLLTPSFVARYFSGKRQYKKT